MAAATLADGAASAPRFLSKRPSGVGERPATFKDVAAQRSIIAWPHFERHARSRPCGSGSRRWRAALGNPWPWAHVWARAGVIFARTGASTQGSANGSHHRCQLSRPGCKSAGISGLRGEGAGPAAGRAGDPRGLGLDEHATQRARRLAGLGYVALAADMFGDRRQARDLQEARELMGELRDDPAKLRARAALRLQPWQLCGRWMPSALRPSGFVLAARLRSSWRAMVPPFGRLSLCMAGSRPKRPQAKARCGQAYWAHWCR